jgi:hypothetical protein
MVDAFELADRERLCEVDEEVPLREERELPPKRFREMASRPSIGPRPLVTA